MNIKIEPNAFKTALQSLRILYSGDDAVFYSIEDGKMILESVGGTHRFMLEFDVVGTDALAMQKTTIGTLTQNLTLLSEYSDLVLSEILITNDGDMNNADLAVFKKLKVAENEEKDCQVLRKRMIVTKLLDTEKENVLKSRAGYAGEVLFTCPAAVSMAAQKAHIIKADSLYLRGNYAYCTSGDGFCRVHVPELQDDLAQDLDADFLYNLVKLGADSYDFYEDYVTCTVDGVLFRLGIPKKAVERELSAALLSLFDVIQAQDIRVYNKEVRSIYGNGPLRITADKKMVVDNKVTVGAPYVLPLKDGNIFEVVDKNGISQKEVTISNPVSQVVGDVWTVGIGKYKDRVVARVSGDCDILFNNYA